MSALLKRADDGAAAELAASVASFALGVPELAILDTARGGTQTAFARQVAMYLCHTGFQLSLARIAAAFGRDRSTVAHACHVIEDRREEPQFELWIAGLEAMMHAAPSEALLSVRS
ncbi:MAG: helix-turn-helix domain-containing protein [Caulobacteraceae bacterium]